ncbi:RNA polymerase sigma-70 factor [Ureibacillus xyleni]|uniref:RNA polymerase sigma-70 factor n=1 Tax=Ureibacillus xyleni TaxID=614648 RepID=A0A285T4E8_9BACL|nr:sigma-70 family RNA polymerase sigma factor [Ureibacillus xyleni]SOC15650.1 RNA polymerase sigma-70 factor [Ureibacillus xyleni]
MEEITSTIITADNREELIDELMSTYGQDILQLVYAYVHNETIAEDLTQEIFVKCYRSLSTYRGKSSIKTWLWRIAINHSKDYLKSWYNQRVQVTDDAILGNNESQNNVEQTIIQQDEDAKLASTVMQLPVKFREVIYLFYYEELSLKEMASVLEVNVNTVKTRLKRGKSLLKEMLEGSSWMND